MRGGGLMGKRGRHPGRPRVTVAEIAARAGVSTATVSRVLNGNMRVSQEARQRVEAAVRETGYLPDASARALASNRTRRIGAVVPTLRNATFAAGVEALQRRLGEERYCLTVSSSDYDPEIEAYQARTLLESGVDGLMLVGFSHPQWLYDLLRKWDVPFVCTYVDRAVPGGGAVGFNNHQAGRIVAEYLLDLGHRNIAVIAAPMRGNDRAADRVEGVREAMRARGLELPNSNVVQSPYSMLDGRLAMHTILELSPCPTAVICGNDSIAFGAFSEAHRQGLSIPRDLSIVGFGDLEFASMLAPPLTTLRLPFTEIGIRAAEYLLARILGTPVRSVTSLEAHLIVRGSTGRPRLDEPARSGSTALTEP